MINSEYTLEETRNVITAGLKGYERLLSLSLDKQNPRWKPLHMAGSWNSRNRRMAKLKSRDHWFKGRVEVAPPTPPSPSTFGEPNPSASTSTPTTALAESPKTINASGLGLETSINVLTDVDYDDAVEDTQRIEEADTVHSLDDQEQVVHTTHSTLQTGLDNVQGRGGVKTTSGQRPGKKRGPGRKQLTLGGKKRMEKSYKRKMKRKVNSGRGKAGIPAKPKRKGDNVNNEQPISVLFVDNTGGGLLAKRLQAEEVKLGKMTGYRVKIAESAGMPLARLLPSTNPWGNQDCGRADCTVCSQGDEKQQNCKVRNILYENICTVCKEDGNQVEKKRNTPYQMDGKGVYVGESS